MKNFGVTGAPEVLRAKKTVMFSVDQGENKGIFLMQEVDIL